MVTKTITQEFIEWGKSSNGAWSKKQLNLLGVFYYDQPLSGWKQRIIGKKIPLKDWNEFLLLKDKHIKYLKE